MCEASRDPTRADARMGDGRLGVENVDLLGARNAILGVGRRGTELFCLSLLGFEETALLALELELLVEEHVVHPLDSVLTKRRVDDAPLPAVCVALDDNQTPTDKLFEGIDPPRLSPVRTYTILHNCPSENDLLEGNTIHLNGFAAMMTLNHLIPSDPASYA